MAEPLKNQFGKEVPRKIGDMIYRQYSKFDRDAFIKEALNGYEKLELLPRGRKIAVALKNHLPENYPKAIKILISSIGPPLEKTENNGMAVFLYLPHIYFVHDYGVAYFEESMAAQHALTQRFSAEFSIRRFIERDPEKTLKRLKEWTRDPNVHVRRLVSEGTRPRLPWASRLSIFQKDPAPVLALLELLKDDPELYVRRSVANNLNDIGKDNPEILYATIRKWLINASPNRRWVVTHALRSAIKRADTRALNVLGFGKQVKIILSNIGLAPMRPKIGGSIIISFNIKNTASKNQQILVDLRIHFVKANGKTNPKTFKLKIVNLGQKESILLKKKISLSKMTTRVHFPGNHKVELLLNGHIKPLGTFVLSK